MTQKIIVVGVDGSEHSFAALAGAAELAEHTDSQLAIVFVYDPSTAAALGFAYEGNAERFLQQTVEELETQSRERAFDLLAGRALKWTFDIVTGDAAHELVVAATRLAASLIVVGGRGHSLLGGLMLGSVAQKLVRASPISVLVVRHPRTDHPEVAAPLHKSAQ